jgi:lipoprotein-anchoring transpeptidase ErfK/SrfK
MRLVGVLYVAAAAALLASAANAEPAVVAAAEPGNPTLSSEPVAASTTVTDSATAPGSGHQATDPALPAAMASLTEEGAADTARLAPPEPTLFADIDLGSQTITVSDESGELYRWPISSARGGYTTPTGTYRVNWTSRMHYSRQYGGAPMPHAVFFTNGVAVHATNAVGMLGRPASHGCVRLAPQNAKTFYNLVHRHGLRLTQITVRGKPPYSAVASDRRRRQYQPVVKPFGGFFGYNPPPQQPRKRGRKVYGANTNTW